MVFQTKCLLSSRSLDHVLGSLIRSPYSEELTKSTVSEILARFSEMSLRNTIGFMRFIREQSSRIHSIKIKGTVSEIMSICELCLFEARRQSGQLSGSDITNVLCFQATCSREKNIFPEILNRVSLVIPDLPPRQVSLCVWAISRIDPRTCADSIIDSVIGVLGTNPEKLLAMSSRDRALLMDAGSRCVVHSRNPKQLLVTLTDFFSSPVSPSSFQECAMMLNSIARVRDYSKKLGMDYSLMQGAALSIIPRISSLFRDKTTVSSESLLTTAWAMALLGVKAQPVLVDLYRCLYARIDSLTSNQKSFAMFLLTTASGIRDSSIADALLNTINLRELTNNNLVNTLVSIDRSAGRVAHAITETVLDEVYERHNILKPFQLVTAASLSSKLDQRLNSNGFSQLMSTIGAKMSSEFSFSDISKLFQIESLDTEFRYRVQRVLTEKIRGKQPVDFSPNDLLMIAHEIRRLGPYKVRANFRVRFNRLLTLAIKNRMISTPAVLTNLRLIDDIGTWHCLPIHVQLTLWDKATDLQKIDVRPPLDPHRNDPPEVRRRRIDTSKLLIRVQNNAAPIESEQEDYSSEGELKNTSMEALELEAVSLDSPSKQFIDLVRKSSAT